MTATLTDRESAEEPEDADNSAVTPDEPNNPPLRPVPAPLQPWRDPHPWIGWLVVVGLGILAGFTRFWGLGFPNSKIFDEAYYPVEAQEMLRFGYEDNRGYMFIVHPPLGKWLIGWSTDLFGNGLSDAFGWRVAPAIFGCLTVIVLARIVRRMTRSNLFGAIAGVLIALDGLSLVLARTAILDVFLEFFVLAAFGALVLDRDHMRARLGGLYAAGYDFSTGMPSLGPRPWRLLAGVLFGLACAVKWTALSFFVLFVLLSFFWDRGAYKVVGIRRRFAPWLRRTILPAAGSLFLAPIGAYLLTYTGWFVGEDGWGRHWADNHGPSTTLHLLGLNVPWTWAWVPSPVRALGSWTLQAYRFHEGLDSGHAYQSNPWSWFVLGRPVDFYYSGDDKTCGAASCSREVLLIGTPLLWWAFIPALLWLAWHYLTTRDWRAGAVWVAFGAGWLVWFQDLKRTMFLFYMAPLVPFMILALTMALGTMLGTGRAAGQDRMQSRRDLVRRRWGQAGVSAFLGLVIADFAWMWPIFTGGLLTYDTWHAHMWLPSWV
ncbi:MAG TPA: phospholipid carrier-dependent glycosyltransferase [Jatrophihabitans sp.]